MKKEEARTFLQKWLNETLDSVRCDHSAEWCEAIDMAIEALSEPINCVECEHYYETEDDTDVHGRCKMDTAHKVDAVSREEYEDIIKDYRKQYENMNNEIADLEAKLSADAVKVVRCKDCDRKLGSTKCPCCTKEHHINEEIFYCAWGERRGEVM